jgi:DNA replication factor GINS
MTEVITYDTLREIQYNERKSEKLYELDDSFYKSVDEYFDRKGPKDDLVELEMRNAKNILKDILDRRERKILNNALTAVRSGMRIDTREMTKREEQVFKDVVKIIKKHRELSMKQNKPVKKVEKKEEIVEEEKIEPEIKETIQENEPTTTYIKVKILQELPEMLGADFKSYGPFKEGDIIEIPEQNAEIFINKQKAEIVS